MIFKVPNNYKNLIDNPIKNEEAIDFIRNTFEKCFSKAFQLYRTSCPLFIKSDNGLNDDLNGQSNAINFNICRENINAEIVHSLAKWKRIKLKQLKVQPYYGIYTDMNAIRTNEEFDNLHSVYVDQWDWEVVISEDDRNEKLLYEIVNDLYNCIKETETKLCKKYKSIKPFLSDKIKFITSNELKNLYKDKSQKEREYLITKEYKTVFISKLGKEYNRASDYDDWNLNGDLLIWSDIIEAPIEITSMGFRVNSESLINQLKHSNEQYKTAFPYHQMIINNELPLTIGGGIGQSRLCMLLLQKAHIGEVQCSIWDDETLRIAKENNVTIL